MSLLPYVAELTCSQCYAQQKYSNDILHNRQQLLESRNAAMTFYKTCYGWQQAGIDTCINVDATVKADLHALPCYNHNGYIVSNGG